MCFGRPVYGALTRICVESVEEYLTKYYKNEATISLYFVLMSNIFGPISVESFHHYQIRNTYCVGSVKEYLMKYILEKQEFCILC